MGNDFDEYAYLEEQLENPDGEKKDAERKDKDRGDKDRDRDRDRGDRDRSDRDRDRGDRRDRDRKDKKERKDRKDKHRSRPDDRDKDRDRKTKRDRSRSKSPRKRQTSEEREAERNKRREEREAEERQRELEELDRDTRTVFAYNLSTRADERDIFEFFSLAGTVLDVRIIYDRNTPKSKGMAYIEMGDKNEIPSALALTGQMLKGQVVMVKASEAEKNVAWEAQQQQKLAMGAATGGLNPLATASMGMGPCKLYVGGLHVNVLEEDLKEIFTPFGDIDFLTVAKDDNGMSQGYAYVQYQQATAAMQAISQLNNLSLAGQEMKVSVAAPTLDPQPMPSLFPQAAPGMPQQQQESVSLDDDGEGLKLDARSRASLMARLAGGEVSIPPPPGGMPGQPAPGMGGLQQVPGPPGMPGMVPGMAGGLQTGLPPPPGSTEQGILGAPSPIPTQALLLKNLFDPEKETEDGWWLDIQEDVKEECGKYGPVQHCFVDKDSKGFVYLKFAGVESAMAAQRALHSRWFAGRMITVDYQFLAVYENRFPDSK
eukprot:gene12182-14392_t